MSSSCPILPQCFICFVRVTGLASALLFAAGVPALAQAQASSIVTVLPGSGEARRITAQQIQVSVEGKQTPPAVWRPYASGPVELVLLIDGSARSSFGRNLDDIAKFLEELPPNVTVGVAYMQNGRAVFSSPMTEDRAASVKQLRLPGGTPGSNASP